MNYAYLRVSTVDKQEFIRQQFVLKDYKIDKYFEEKISGTKKASSRPEFEKLLRVINEGDSIYFESMSRMARSMQDLIETTDFLANKKKVKIIFIKENIVIGGNSIDAMTGLIFNIMGAFAQFERDLISDRTKQCLQAKKMQGLVLGRPKSLNEKEITQIKDLYHSGVRMQDIAIQYNISIASVSRIVNKGEKR